MRFKDITSITGINGLFKMENQKPSGVIVTSLTEGWTKFVSSREHLFSPLDSISIYSANDTVELLDVMLKAYALKDSNPPVDPKADNETLKAYFEKVLPEYDKEKVHLSDIKKFVKWFAILDEKGILKTELEEKEKQEKADAEFKTLSEDKTGDGVEATETKKEVKKEKKVKKETGTGTITAEVKKKKAKE
ncbi:MAG: DUF5606 domain-containing protein [Chitinophagales bacterium]